MNIEKSTQFIHGKPWNVFDFLYTTAYTEAWCFLAIYK